MSAGARSGTVLAAIEREFHRLMPDGNHFAFPIFYAANMRALAGSMGPRFPRNRQAREMALLGVLRGKESP